MDLVRMLKRTQGGPTAPAPIADEALEDAIQRRLYGRRERVERLVAPSPTSDGRPTADRDTGAVAARADVL